MKTTKWMVAALGICSTSLALFPQPGQGGETGAYFKFDVGAALPQDVAITSLNGLQLPLTTSLGTFSDVFGVPIPNGAAGSLVTIDQPKMVLGTGVRGDFIAGYSFSKAFSFEVEAGVVYNPFDKLRVGGSVGGVSFSEYATVSDMSLWQVPILANVVFTVPLDSRFKPFVGAGVGGIWTIMSGEDTSNSDFTFAFQGLAGLNFALAENVEVGVVYKFLGTLQHDIGGVKTDPLYTSSIMALFTFRF